MSSISLDLKSNGVLFSLELDEPIPVEKWTLYDKNIGVSTLVRLRDEGQVVEQDDGHKLLITWQNIARLTNAELRHMRLPDAMPFALEITTKCSILDIDFRIFYGYISADRRILGVTRKGAWLQAGGNNYVLLNPLYEVVQAIDDFNKAKLTDTESRMLRWGQIAELLPDGTVVGDHHLRSMKIVVASSFELRPFVNAKGEPDFDPVLGRHETTTTTVDDEKQAFVKILNMKGQENFSHKFRSLSYVKHRYTLGDNNYVVLTPQVERVLSTVRRAQSGTTSERLDFLHNVSGYLRGAVDTDSQDSEIDLDVVFNDDGLSDRVRGIGVWKEKVVPWIKQASEPWLPPEQLGLQLGSQIVRVSHEELPLIRKRVEAAMKDGKRTVQIGDSISVPAEVNTLESIDELIRRSQPLQRPKAEKQRSYETDSHDTMQVLELIDNLETIGYQRKRKIRDAGITETVPALSTSLLPHQEEGLRWLFAHWDAGSWGALLADDMGLGKTLTALAFLSCLQKYARFQEMESRPILVVAPTGLLYNWKDEHDKHLAGNGLGHCIQAHGNTLRHIRTSAAMGRSGELDLGHPLLNTEALCSADWVLTTYETLRDYQHSFGRIRWRAGVFDEAQKIKNPGIRLTEAALAMDIEFALLMTGTPVENRPADIWSLLDRAEPGRFGTLKDFSKLYETETGVASTLTDLHHALTQPDETSSPALMLRRLKEDRIPNLPNRLVHRRIVDMPSSQAEEYARIVLDREQGHNMLKVLHHLRSVSLHPRSPDGGNLGNYIKESARLFETFTILEEIAAQNEKALLFLESREMQDFLIGALRQRFKLPEDVLVINGQVSSRARKDRVDRFQNRKGFDVMILSPRAGGVGLTLTAANHVIHLSRWWNPAVEDQCTDRVYRIGQHRTVHVYLLLAKHPRFGDHSFDLKLDSLITRKRDMNRRVLAPYASTSTDIRDLYRSIIDEASASRYAVTEDDRVDVDLLEPTAFESWVLNELSLAGYECRQTPRSGDRGADGLAYYRGTGEEHTIFVQCKHMNRDKRCGVAAVRQVLASLADYEAVGKPIPMVVSNAVGFTSPALYLAKIKGVSLVSRHSLPELRTWRKDPEKAAQDR